MNIRLGGFLLCSCFPLLSCLMDSIGQLFSATSQSQLTADSGEEQDAAASANVQAQRHFRQIQHISQP
ncbi:hypothetical protein QN277_015947 [Acacia crassicarpa]|uniref:Uncharacterized protein n=1 Tax=Acacia crassicarpa TaxID=499986 RepID=A0AAE1MVN3_9FABA|nr:hypothetical protein QN277_015947 [Acacia crassicarpa]